MARKSDNKKLYKENNLKFALKFYKKSGLALDIIYRMLSTRRIRSFSVIVVQSKYNNFHSFLKENKRQTDLLVKIDKKEGIYALLCQETKVDGGYFFMKRLLDKDKQIDMRMSIVGIESAKYDIKDILFIILDSFLKVKNAKSEKEKIYYRTIR